MITFHTTSLTVPFNVGVIQALLIRTHIYYEHLSQTKRKALLRDGSTRFVNDMRSHRYGSVNEDYDNLKITYWRCQLCKVKGTSKATLTRKRSTVEAHLRAHHKNMTIPEYEKRLEAEKASGVGSFDVAAAMEMRKAMEDSSKIM